MRLDNKLIREAEMTFSDKEKQKLEALGIRSRRNLVRAGPITGIL